MMAPEFFYLPGFLWRDGPFALQMFYINPANIETDFNKIFVIKVEVIKKKICKSIKFENFEKDY